MRTSNESGGDIRIGGLPLDHELLRLFEVAVFHHHLRIRLRARHEADLLQRRLIVNIHVDPGFVKAPFQLPRFGRFIERRNSYHKRFLDAQQRALVDQTSNHCRVQDFGREADNPVCAGDLLQAGLPASRSRGKPFVEHQIDKHARDGNV